MKNTYSMLMVNVFRWIMSTIFVLSGFVKLLDPTGTAYKIQEYYIALFPGTDSFPFLCALFVSIALSVLECCLGAMLFFGVFRRVTSIFTTLFLLIYTPLTGWLYASDAVADCGCFGDFIHLSNAQTFWKNVVLLILSATILLGAKKVKRIVPQKTSFSLLWWSLFFAFAVAIVNIYEEPLIDFRPFYVGQNIPAAMEWPENVEEQPEILDFDLSIVPESCYVENHYAVLLIAPHLEEASRSNVATINSIYDEVQQMHIPFVCLTASSNNAIQDWRYHTGALYSFAFVDALTLETMARTSPALLVMRQGTILKKWGCRNLPEAAAFKAYIASAPQVTTKVKHDICVLLLLLAAYALPVLVYVKIKK